MRKVRPMRASFCVQRPEYLSNNPVDLPINARLERSVRLMDVHSFGNVYAARREHGLCDGKPIRQHADLTRQTEYGPAQIVDLIGDKRLQIRRIVAAGILSHADFLAMRTWG